MPCKPPLTSINTLLLFLHHHHQLTLTGFHHSIERITMAKFAVFVALLVVFVAFVEASTYTVTTTTTIEEAASNPRGEGSQERCREQFKRQQQLRHCQMYMQQQMQQSSPSVSLRMVVNPQQEQHLRQCCQQLQNMDRQCRCEGIKQMVMEQQQQQEGEEGGQMGEMMRMAENLPGKCNLEPQRCRMQARWF